MTSSDVQKWLADRANSYERDRAVLYTIGWTDFATMFGSMRDELLRCAADLAKAEVST